MITNNPQNQPAHTELIQQPVKETFSFFDDPPPPWVSWSVAAVVIITLLFRVFEFISKDRKSRADIARRREDEYWFRSVVLENCLKQINNFTKQSRQLIDSSIEELELATSEVKKTEIYARLLKKYRAIQNLTIFELSQLSLFEETYYHECVAFLEKLEDSIIASMGSDVLGVNVSTGGLRSIKVQSTKIAILRYLKNVHSKLF